MSPLVVWWSYDHCVITLIDIEDTSKRVSERVSYIIIDIDTVIDIVGVTPISITVYDT